MKARRKKGAVEITVPRGVYSADTVMRAAYAFSDRYSVFFDRQGRSRLKVEFRPKQGQPADTESLVGEFANECLAQALRLRISKESASVRDAIVSAALGGAVARPGSASAEPGRQADYTTDPLGIAIPWEEKYGKKAKAKQTARSRRRTSR